MSEWRECRLEDVVQLKRGFDLATRERRPGPFPVVGSAGISGWHDEGPILGPALVLGRAGSSMGVASYCETERFWPLNTSLFVEDFKGNDPRFIFHLFQLTDLTGYNSGSAQPMLNRNYIRNVVFLIPDIEEQRAISDVLKALDEKIATNDRIAATAEDLALVIASEERWPKRVPLASIVSYARNQISPENISADVVAHYSLPAFDEDKLPALVHPGTIKSGKFLVDGPAVLLSKLNPATPRIWSVRPKASVPALASTEFLVLKPVEGIAPDEIWAVSNQPTFISDLVSMATGTSNSHQRVRPNDLLATEVVDPRSMPQIDRETVSAIAECARQARLESWNLACLRDTLLPKLMSGEIRVRGPQKAVEDVT
jgi:type I restriction enzyme, S subunit